jgi:sugar lactone lactonase YvrE
LYRVSEEDLTNASLPEKELEQKVEKVTETPACDGMLMGADGSLYLTDLEHAGVARLDLGNKKLSTAVSDKERLLWPDTLARGADGTMFVTASQIEKSPRFNKGTDARTTPYMLYKWKEQAEGGTR